MRDVLVSTSTDYDNRIKSLAQQIETNKASVERMQDERAQLISAKKLVDAEIAKLPAPEDPAAPKRPANPRP